VIVGTILFLYICYKSEYPLKYNRNCMS